MSHGDSERLMNKGEEDEAIKNLVRKSTPPPLSEQHGRVTSRTVNITHDSNATAKQNVKVFKKVAVRAVPIEKKMRKSDFEEITITVQ